MLNFRLEKLSNSFKIITAPLKNTKAVSVLILAKTGSRYETAQNSGIAHFLEHMVFKGTKKRPQTFDISKELDGVGASYNAFTGEEYTGFYIRVESSHFDLALDILTDMLYHSKFEPAEIEKEKGVIIEEIRMYQDMPQIHVGNLLKDMLWPGQALGRKISGTPETVASFNRQNFLDFLQNYQPQNMIITVAGDPVSKEGTKDWTAKIKKIFEKLPNKSPANFEKVHDKQSTPQVKIFSKKTDQAHFILGFRSITRTDPRRPVLKVLNNIMGGTMSSRLFIELREKRGLGYYVSTDFDDFADTGFWGAAAGVDIKRVEQAIEVILAEFGRAKSELVGEEELKRGKENLKGHLYLALEESMNVAEFLADQELFWGKIEDAPKIDADIQAVSRKDVLKLAQEIFRPENLNLAMVGPFDNQDRFEKIVEKYK